jgi:hypothetical protein
MSGTYPPLEKITPDNHGPYVIMADYIPMFITVMVVLTRLTTRYRLAHRITLDDFFISTASVRIRPSAVSFADVDRLIDAGTPDSAIDLRSSGVRYRIGTT